MDQPGTQWLSAAWREMFGHTTSARDEPATNPPCHEDIAAMEDARFRLIELVRIASAAAFARPHGEEGVGFADTPLEAADQPARHKGDDKAANTDSFDVSSTCRGAFPDRPVDPQGLRSFVV